MAQITLYLISILNSFNCHSLVDAQPEIKKLN